MIFQNNKQNCSNMQERINEENVSNIKQKIRTIIKDNKEKDMFHKMFLKPIQIALKTSQTEKDEEKINTLPYGLKQVIKEDISNNRFRLDDFNSFGGLTQEQKTDYSFIRDNNYDNLVSLLLGPDGREGLKLAICICMYSEDKGMLRKTLTGVSKNIASMVRNGLSPDEIGVFVIMDGIQPVDPSVVQFFAEMQKQNAIYLDDDVEPSDPHDLLATQMTELDEHEVININHIMFDEVEYKDRVARRFENRKKEYHEIKQMLKKISKMEKDHTLTLQNLDKNIVPFFIDAAREVDKKMYGDDEEESRKKPNEYFMEEYGNSISKSRPIIRQALQEARRHCEEYIEQRNNLALLNSFRVEIDLNNNEDINNQEENSRGDAYRSASRDEEEVGQNCTFMNLFMVTKYKNRGKLSSHNWFFNGFCREFKPEYSVLLDVGLAPEKDALEKMVNHMVRNSKTGGVCGYMALRIQRLQDQEEAIREHMDCLSELTLHLVDIQRAQQLEYHFAHLIDKPFESTFKFIHVLPGAFSAYKMEALYSYEQEEDTGLLRKYFQSINQTHDITIRPSHFSTVQVILKGFLPEILYNCFCGKPDSRSEEQLLYDQNIYLAEDRTLCMGIHQRGYDLQYLPDAYSYVDPIKTLNGLLGQRKRWINGSFFAFEKVKSQLSKNEAGQCCLNFQMLYLTFMNILAFVSPALFMFTSHVAMTAFKIDVLRNQSLPLSGFFSEELSNFLVYFVDFVYIMLYLALIFFSMFLTNKSNKFVPYIYITSTMLGFLSIGIFVLLGVDLVRGLADPENASFLTENEDEIQKIPGGVQTVQSLRYVILGTFGIYVIPLLSYTILFRQCNFLVDIIFSTFSFIYYGSTYLNILNIYALCRIDDISWGTKGLDTGEVNPLLKQRKQSWKRIKIIHVGKYVTWNIIVASALITFGNSFVERFYVTYVIMVLLLFTLFLKVILGVIYFIIYKCQDTRKGRLASSPGDLQNPVQKYFDDLKQSLYASLDAMIDDLKKDCTENKTTLNEVVKQGGSRIHQIGRKRAAKKQNQIHQSRISKIKKTEQSRLMSKRKINENLPASSLAPVKRVPKKQETLPAIQQQTIEAFEQSKDELKVEIGIKGSKKKTRTFARDKPLLR